MLRGPRELAWAQAPTLSSTRFRRAPIVLLPRSLVFSVGLKHPSQGRLGWQTGSGGQVTPTGLGEKGDGGEGVRVKGLNL